MSRWWWTRERKWRESLEGKAWATRVDAIPIKERSDAEVTATARYYAGKARGLRRGALTGGYGRWTRRRY